MPAVQKINEKTLRDESNRATQNDVSDILASIQSLGNQTQPVIRTRSETVHVQEQKKIEPQIETVAVSSPVSAESKDDKPGYISLVIPNSMKKKWKMYCTQHEISLTDCIKLAMKNLEVMEQQQIIKIDSGVVIYRGQ